jgi:hypothetical protein
MDFKAKPINRPTGGAGRFIKARSFLEQLHRAEDSSCMWVKTFYVPARSSRPTFS